MDAGLDAIGRVGVEDAPHNLETYSYLTKGTEVIPTERSRLRDDAPGGMREPVVGLRAVSD